MDKFDLQQLKPKQHPLKQLIKNNNITQMSIAIYFGVPLSTFSHWMLGYKKIPQRYHTKMDKLMNDLR